MRRVSAEAPFSSLPWLRAGMGKRAGEMFGTCKGRRGPQHRRHSLPQSDAPLPDRLLRTALRSSDHRCCLWFRLSRGASPRLPEQEGSVLMCDGWVGVKLRKTLHVKAPADVCAMTDLPTLANLQQPSSSPQQIHTARPARTSPPPPPPPSPPSLPPSPCLTGRSSDDGALFPEEPRGSASPTPASSGVESGPGEGRPDGISKGSAPPPHL